MSAVSIRLTPASSAMSIWRRAPSRSISPTLAEVAAAAEAHRPERQRRDAQPGAAQLPVLHACLLAVDECERAELIWRRRRPAARQRGEVLLEPDAVGRRGAGVVDDQRRPAAARPAAVGGVPGPAQVGDAVRVGPAHVAPRSRRCSRISPNSPVTTGVVRGERRDRRVPARCRVAAGEVVGVEADDQLVVGVGRLVARPAALVGGVARPPSMIGLRAPLERTASTSCCIPAVR